MDPNLKKGKWSSEEDERLRELYSQLGPRWKEIGESRRWEPGAETHGLTAQLCEYPDAKMIRCQSGGEMSCVRTSPRTSRGRCWRTRCYCSCTNNMGQSGRPSQIIYLDEVRQHAGTAVESTRWAEVTVARSVSAVIRLVCSGPSWADVSSTRRRVEGRLHRFAFSGRNHQFEPTDELRRR